MKKIRKFILNALCFFMALSFINSNAQDTWVAYSHTINIKEYVGHRFRFHAVVRAEVEDDSASAHLWVRIDTEKGMCFFDNMGNRPIRGKEWNKYIIEGKIDSNATQLLFGPLCSYNGKFYFKDLQLEIETKKNKWISIYTSSFQSGKNNLDYGVGGSLSNGRNKLFKADAIADVKNPTTKCLLLEGVNVPNYGQNRKVGKFANVNGIKLYYEIYGDGKPLVVLHGNGGSIEDASFLYDTLRKNYKLIAIDSRGQGNSTDTKDELTYDKMAADVNELLEQLKIDSAFVWGHSDGAIIGLILAMDYPKQVKKLLAFGANIQADSLAVFPWELNHMQKVCKENKSAFDVKLNTLMLKYPNIPYSKLAQIKAPVLIMAGDRDAIRPEHTLKLFQNIPNSQMCILPGSTHFAAWEKKELFLQLLNDFFNKPFKMPDTKEWWGE